ncbi:MAG: hypothetical protein SNG49_08685 [Rikenellaceae bacterium]
MKNLIALLALLITSITAASAQQLTIQSTPSAQEALDAISQTKQPSTVMGYRIGIFFDNSADARIKATEAKTKFTTSFPTQPVHMVYESPYYKVSVGNCLTEEEAIMLFERVRPVFPNAYVMRERMKISDFVEDKSSELPSIDSVKRRVVTSQESVVVE